MRALGLVLLSITVAGCSSYSSNLQVGNDQSYASLKDQREAVRTVKMYEATGRRSSDPGSFSGSMSSKLR